MSVWWNALSVYQRILFVISCSASLLFLIQLIFLLIGFGDNDLDVDDVDINDTDFGDLFGLKLITLRGICSFFCIGGWTAFVIIEASSNIALGTCLGVLAGLVTMFLLALFMKQTQKLEENGNIDINNTIGLIGNVYLTIPNSKSGVGKINVVVQERMTEYDAVTSDLEDIKTGQDAKIISCNNNILEVTKLK